MKITLITTHFILFLQLISSTLNAQSQAPVDSLTTEIKRIEMKLEKFRSQHQSGVLISIIGGIIATAPIFISDQVVVPVVILGSVISIIGSIRTFASYRHLRYSPSPSAERQSELKKSDEFKKEKPKNWWTPRGNID